MTVFAIYDKNDKFIIGFPTRSGAETYGKEVLGVENGWEYSIKEKFLTNSPQHPKQTIPCTVSDVPYIPYTPPIPHTPAPYTPNIWCGGDAVKDVRATYEWNETGDGV